MKKKLSTSVVMMLMLILLCSSFTVFAGEINADVNTKDFIQVGKLSNNNIDEILGEQKGLSGEENLANTDFIPETEVKIDREKLINDPDKKAEFDQLVEQYHQYNSEVLPNYKSIGEKFAENLARVRSEKPYSLQAAKNIANEEALIFKYNPEEIKKNNQELALLFSKMNKENKEGIISQIKDNFLKIVPDSKKLFQKNHIID